MKYIDKECKEHGITKYILEGRGYYRCVRCRNDGVSNRRRKMKDILIEYKGGKCIICGYNKYNRALHFHHLDPKIKSFGISEKGFTRGINKAKEEVDKCVLLCANCHSEVEGGIINIPE